MLSLNNKGFAISGILYTLFTVFLLIMLSVLAGLQAKKMMLERSIIGLEESYAGEEITNQDKLNAVIDDLKNKKRAPITGKYTFKVTTNDDSNTFLTYCSSYLYKNDEINNDIKLFPKDCNDYKYNFSFDNDKSAPNLLILNKIYSMEVLNKTMETGVNG